MLTITKKKPWNLTPEGKANIIDCLESKFHNAQLELENTEQVTIRIDKYELIIMRFMMDAYMLSRARYEKAKRSGQHGERAKKA